MQPSGTLCFFADMICCLNSDVNVDRGNCLPRLYGRYGSLLWKISLVYIGDVAHLYGRYDSFIWEIWLICMGDMTHLYGKNHSCMCPCCRRIVCDSMGKPM